MAQCKPELLAQMSSGELSFDQAVPHFSYKDNDEFLDNMMVDGFFDPIGTQVEVGSTIQLTGRVATDPFVPEPVIQSPAVTVWVKELLPAASPDKYFVLVAVGPRNGFYISNADVPGTPVNTAEHLQDSRLLFRGFVNVTITGPIAADGTIYPVTLSNKLGIITTDMAFGVLGGSELSDIVAGPCGLIDTWCGPGNNQISYRFWKIGANPQAAGSVYVYTEVHRPSSPIINQGP